MYTEFPLVSPASAPRNAFPLSYKFIILMLISIINLHLLHFPFQPIAPNNSLFSMYSVLQMSGINTFVLHVVSHLL